MTMHADGVVAEEAAALLGWGTPPELVAEALGIQLASVARALERAKMFEYERMCLDAESARRKRITEALGRAA
jgi:hypothetical protein